MTHWIENQRPTSEKVMAVMNLAERIGDSGSWTAAVVIWLCRAYLDAAQQRDALGERLIKEMTDGDEGT